MIKIIKKPAPLELENLKNNLMKKCLTPEQEYEKLINLLKSKIRNILMEEQGHICAYCMREIPDGRVSGTLISDVTIEHWIARNYYLFVVQWD